MMYDNTENTEEVIGCFDEFINEHVPNLIDKHITEMDAWDHFAKENPDVALDWDELRKSNEILANNIADRLQVVPLNERGNALIEIMCELKNIKRGD